MKQTLLAKWKQTPERIRRPVVLFVGLLIVLLSGTVGWLPGPGGIPIFLLGIAILSSEFHWADRFKNYILDHVRSIGHWMKENKLKGFVVLTISLSISAYITYTLIQLR